MYYLIHFRYYDAACSVDGKSLKLVKIIYVENNMMCSTFMTISCYWEKGFIFKIIVNFILFHMFVNISFYVLHNYMEMNKQIVLYRFLIINNKVIWLKLDK